jgi:hypothetical protein
MHPGLLFFFVPFFHVIAASTARESSCPCNKTFADFRNNSTKRVPSLKGRKNDASQVTCGAQRKR